MKYMAAMAYELWLKHLNSLTNQVSEHILMIKFGISSHESLNVMEHLWG